MVLITVVSNAKRDTHRHKLMNSYYRLVSFKMPITMCSYTYNDNFSDIQYAIPPPRSSYMMMLFIVTVNGYNYNLFNF